MNTHIQPFVKIRRFSSNSKLHKYLAFRFTGVVTITKLDYKYTDIILYVTQIIEKDGLYDIENPSIILCDYALADALNIPIFHITDLKKIISRQLFELPISSEWRDHTGFVPFNPVPTEIKDFVKYPICTYPINIDTHAAPSWAKPEAIAIKARELLQKEYPPEDYYYVSDNLLTAFRTLDRVHEDQTIFPYKEIEAMFSRYLEENKENLFDIRHTQIAIIRGDILYNALKVQAFHKYQAVALLRTQIKPFRVLLSPTITYVGANTYEDPIRPDVYRALEDLGFHENH